MHLEAFFGQVTHSTVQKYLVNLHVVASEGVVCTARALSAALVEDSFSWHKKLFHE
jgi:hypothetical protein